MFCEKSRYARRAASLTRGSSAVYARQKLGRVIERMDATSKAIRVQHG